jgi:y4mF family transcriptional regulator
MVAQRTPRKRYKDVISPDRESSIAAFVRDRRRRDGLPQRQLAELAGVGARVIWDLERGKPTMRLDAVNRVLAVFGKELGIVDAPREAT